MSSELAQWFTPAILVLGFLYLDRSIRSVRRELTDFRDRMDHEIGGLREHGDKQAGHLRDQMDRQIGSLRDHVDHQIGTLRDRMDDQIGDLRDRMGRIEGTLDVLRDFFVRNGRGTAA